MMKRLFPAEAEAAYHAPVDHANEVVERKFHDTLEEVFALKQILQEFLTEPTTRPSTLVPSPPKAVAPPSHARQNDPQRPEGDDPQPHVRASRSSERLLRQSVHFEPNFQARMRYYMMQTQRRKDQIQAAEDEKTQEELKLAPTINQRSKRIHRSVHHLHAWEHEKKLKLEELRQAERRREVEEVTGAPRVSLVSRRMSMNRVDDLAQCKVEDRLHLLGLIYEYQQEERELEAAAKCRGGAGSKPRLAPHSSGLVRKQNDPVYERLYELSKRPNHASDREPQQSPQRTKSKETVDAAIQRLAEMGKIYHSKRAEMAQLREQQVKELQSMQKISTKSRVLADKARSKTKQAHSTHHRKCPCCRQPEQDSAREHHAISSKQASAIYERQREWLAQKERKCQEERDRREAAEAAALVFRNPEYRAAWGPLEPSVLDEVEGAEERDAIDASSPGRVQQQQHRRTNRSFFEKSTRWADERQQQLTRERMVWDEILLRDCTFKPKLCSAPLRGSGGHGKEESGAARTPRSPRSLLKAGGMSLDQGFFSRPNLRTPMLSADGDEVSSDDGMDSDDGGGENTPDDGESQVIYFDQGEQIRS